MYQGTLAATIDTSAWLHRFEGLFEPKPQYMIPVLLYVQSQEGYLPSEAILAVARYLRVPESKVFGVVTFYQQFRTKPMGKNMIRVCLGTACHVQGGGRVHDVTRESLNMVEKEDTTADLLFTVEPVACLGCCSLAPVVMINETTHGRLDAPKVRKLMRSVQKDAKKNQA